MGEPADRALGVAHTVIVSSTEWENYDNLRDHPSASPEMRTITQYMKKARAESTPFELKFGDWHLPMVRLPFSLELINDDRCEGDPEGGWRSATSLELAMISVARCARVSYETHDKGQIDTMADLALHDTLLKSGHMSPFEHQAQVGHIPNPHCHVWPIDVKINSPEDVCLDCGTSRALWNAKCKPKFCGNFRRPWVQYRKQINGEDVFRG